jgi:hypothetical protein
MSFTVTSGIGVGEGDGGGDGGEGTGGGTSPDVAAGLPGGGAVEPGAAPDWAGGDAGAGVGAPGRNWQPATNITTRTRHRTAIRTFGASRWSTGPGAWSYPPASPDGGSDHTMFGAAGAIQAVDKTGTDRVSAAGGRSGYTHRYVNSGQESVRG